MLESLKIKNVAVIDEANVNFKPGLNILSGETGAGKSIVIEAISLLLGSRATTDLIRAGCDEALVEGVFDISELGWMRDRLIASGFSLENEELMVKRTVSKNGKHRILINGEHATLANLQKICEDLIDLCGQHEHQSLLKPAVQMDLLDRFGGITVKTAEFEKLFHHYSVLNAEKNQLLSNESERSRRADFLKFQIDELRDAGLDADEDAKLQTEKALLQTGEARLGQAESARTALEADDAGALAALRIAAQKLKSLSQLDESAVDAQAAVARALAEAEEASLQLNRYLGSIDLDPERLEQVQTRLSKLAELRRKYGASSQEMIAQLEVLEREYSTIANADGRLKELDQELTALEKKLKAQAKILTEARTKVSQLLAKKVTGELKDLKMADAQFMIELETKTDLTTWKSNGADDIRFVVQTNAGDTARPLGKVASGGELSRLMLAIRRVIADRGGIGVYLFDEIDAGIGGQTAFEVGKKLKSVASYNQVICITHLPQVAAFADHHLSVQKTSANKKTMTTVVELTTKERKEEIARMLGGPELTKKSLENAGELLGLAR